MTLGDLAFASYIFSTVDRGAYDKFRQKVDGDLNLEEHGHAGLLLDWLRKWGMRSVAKARDNSTRSCLIQWYRQNGATLPSPHKDIWDLTEQEIDAISTAYDSLKSIQLIGPTGAAKSLFALRPRALPAWDEAIRKKLKKDGLICGNDADLYGSFIRHIKRAIIPILQQERIRRNVSLTQLANDIGRGNCTVPQLVDRYYWITITRKVSPSIDTLGWLTEWYSQVE